MRIRHAVAAAAVLLVPAIYLTVLRAADSPVADAAMKGDKAAVQTLIKQKADVNLPQADGATAIQWAAYRNDMDLADALIYCDMVTGPDGHRMTVEHRLNEIRVRYGPGNVVTRALARSGPELTSAVSRITCKLARTAPSAGPDGPAMALAAN